MANTAQSVLDVERGELGYSRWTDSQAGTKYGRWYAEQSGESYYGESGVPFCAMFQSWCFSQAGASAPGLPGAYCPYIVNAGYASGACVANEDARAGDLVLFDWNHDGNADHIGMVESNDGILHTIEGNTNNGVVARRDRDYSVVRCIIRPNYDGSQPATSPTPSPAPSAGGIDVDGYWGSGTTSALQAHFGTPQDGSVSSQSNAWKNSNPGLTSGWEWVDGESAQGSQLIAAIQRTVGVSDDGLIGPDTIRAIQSHMGTAQDGCLSEESSCVMEMQERLNRGTF